MFCALLGHTGELLQDHWSSGCICKNKYTDQRLSNRAADQHLCFRYTDSTVPFLPN